MRFATPSSQRTLTAYSFCRFLYRGTKYAVWIEENTPHPIDAAVSIAMLETAFDRYIDVLGATDAFELVEACFRRRAEKFRKSLQ